MGGNLFKEKTRRYFPEEYQNLENYLSKNINKAFKYNVFHRIPYYRSKPSFGDLDFVLDISQQPDWKNKLIEIFSLKYYKNNGTVFSFVINDFQVDAILINDPMLISPAVNYYSYNDISNLLGRISHRIGFKLSHAGSFIILRDSTRILSEILLSRDYTDSLNLLKMDPTVFFNGFDTTYQMFEYVVSSPYFNKDIFLLDNRNHRAKVRDKKRVIYKEFLQWIEENNIQSNYLYDKVNDHGGHGIREPFFEDIVEYIKNTQNGRDLQQEIQNILENNAINEQFKSKYFNGVIIGEQTGLVGKELGECMSIIKQHPFFPETAMEKKYFMNIFSPENALSEWIKWYNSKQ